MNIIQPTIRDKKGRFLKGFKPPTAFKKGTISWNKGIKQLQTTGEKNPKWKGGRYIQEGYYLIMKKDHPNNIKGYIYEHRLVMEEKIGRLLTKGEIVHHINGNKLDNRPCNLELFSRSQHAKLHNFGSFRKVMKSKYVRN